MLDRRSFSGYMYGNKQTFWHDPEPMPYFLINDTTTEQTLSILIKTCKMLINTWLSVKKLWERALYTLEISLFVRSFVRLFVCVCLFVWLFVCLGFFVPLENFSLIWRHQHCRWSAANFDLGTALIAIEKWGATPTVTRGIRLLWSSPMSRLGFDHPTLKRGERSNRLRPAAVTKKLFLFQCLYILMVRTNI